MGLQNWYKELITAGVHTLQAPPRNYTMPDGRTISNFNLSPELMTSQGWREWTAEELEEWHEQYDPEPTVRTVCTKYQLMVCLRTYYSDLYTSLMALLTSPTSDEQKQIVVYWNAVQELDRTNDDFKTIQAALSITDEQVEQIFAKIDEAEIAESEN